MMNKNSGTPRKVLKALAFCASASFLLASCQSASPSSSAAEDYLEVLRDGDTKAIAEMSCLENPQLGEGVVPGISSWEFVDEYLEVSENDPLATSTNVLTKIKYEGIASPVENLFEVTVWKTDDLYQNRLRFTEMLNQANKSTKELIERTNEMLGDETD